MYYGTFVRFLRDAQSKGILRFKEALPLSGVSTVGTGGAADLFVLPYTIDALCRTVRAATIACVPYVTVGASSDIFYSDAGFRGAVICTKKVAQMTFDSAHGSITAECGTPLALLSEKAVSFRRSGLEGLCSVPGTVGGGLCLNASAYGQSVSDTLTGFTVYLPEKDAFEERTKADGRFAYRASAATAGNAVIVRATFEGEETDEREIRAKMAEDRAKRRSSQPTGVRSAGSFYKKPFAGGKNSFEERSVNFKKSFIKNSRGEEIPPENVSAGLLIEACGLKGFAVGGAKVSEKHANFFINHRNARTSDFERLDREVAVRVAERFGVVLEKEVLFLKETF